MRRDENVTHRNAMNLDLSFMFSWGNTLIFDGLQGKMQAQDDSRGVNVENLLHAPMSKANFVLLAGLGSVMAGWIALLEWYVPG